VAGADFVACDLVRYAAVDNRREAISAPSRTSVTPAPRRARDELEAAGGRSILLKGHLFGRGAAHEQLRRPAGSRGASPRPPGGRRLLRALLLVGPASKTRPGRCSISSRWRNESDFTADLIELARHLRAADAPFDPDLLEEITSGLPKDLRARAAAQATAELLEHGLTVALGD